MVGQDEGPWHEAEAVETLLAVANTRHGPGSHRGRAQAGWSEPHDHLTDGEATTAYLEGRVQTPASPPGPDDLARLRQVRSLVWRLWEDEPDLAWETALENLLEGSHYRLDSQGRLISSDAGWGGLVASTLPGLLSLRAHRERLKRCENPRCGWLFVDRSRNRSRRWCEMATCGNRAKARRRARRTLD